MTIRLPLRFLASALCLLACTLQVRAQQTLSFTPDQTAGCPPLSNVVFTNTSTYTGATLYTWDLGNGASANTLSVSQTVAASYPKPGTYTVTLTATGPGAPPSFSRVITVYAPPTVSFSAAPAGGCTPLPVTFTSTSTPGDGTIAGYTWDFGDGSPVNTAGPATTHTYTAAINPAVTLTVVNSYGCSISMQEAGLVSPEASPQANFSADSTVLCLLSNAEQFTNTSTGAGALTYTWNFGDGSAASSVASPAYTYSQKGLYTVSLIATTAQGCADTLSRPAYIRAADFTPAFHVASPVCAGAAISLSDSSNPAANADSWTFGDNGAMATGLSVSHTFAAAGIFPVTLTGTFGTCLASRTANVAVNPLPFQKGFIINPSTPCGVAPEQVAFEDTTQAAVKWTWYSGNPAGPFPFGMEASVTYTYPQNGTYHPSLILTNAAGCTDTVSGVVAVGTDSAALAIQASNYISCTSVTVQCSATAPVAISSYQWNFGDGTTSANATPAHTYGSPGVYHISLTFVNSTGCTSTTTWTDSIQILLPPKPTLAIFGGNPVICGSSPVEFISQGTNATGFIWDPGDGQSFEMADSVLFYRYQKAGAYTVELIAFNAACSDTVIKTDFVTVTDAFAKILSGTNTCDGTRGLVSFIDSATASATGWSWDFGDGTVVTGTSAPPATITHTYTKSGDYPVFFYVTGGLQCNVYDGINVPVLLKQQPVLSSALSSICASGSLGVQITGVDTNYRDPYWAGGPFDYSFVTWQYGDGSLFSEPNYGSYGTSFQDSLYYLTPGKDSLRFITQSAGFGCYDTSNWIPLKIGGPVAGYTEANGFQCYKLPISLTDTSHGVWGVPLVKWEWSFGDGAGDTTGAGGTVTHTYAAPYQLYYPRLTVVDSEGCSATSPNNDPGVVLNGPQAAFSWSPSNITPGTTAVFTNNTQGPFSNVLWTFQSDGSTSTDPVSVSHTYPNITIDTVTLIVYSNLPTYCPSDTLRRAVPVSYVTASFTTVAQYLSQSNCPPLQVTCTSTTFDVTQYSWNFGDGSALLTVPNPTHTYSTAGKYYITLTATGQGVTLTVPDSVTVGGPFGIPLVDVPQGCSPAAVTLTASSLTDVASYTLDFGDGTVLAKQPPDTVSAHVYPAAGIYSPILTLKDGEGCMVPYYLSAPVIADSLHAGFLPDTRRLCDSGLVRYTPSVYSLSSGLPGDTLRYHWIFGTGNPGDTSDSPAPAFDYTAPGKYIVQVGVSSVPGCASVVTDSILAVQSARGIITAPDSGCAGVPVLFESTATVTPGGAPTYQWIFPGAAPGGGTNISQNPPPEVFPPGMDTVLLVVGLNGCFDTTSAPLQIFGNPVVAVSPADTVVCKGNPVPLSALGGVSYQWGDTAGLSSYSIAAPVAQPAVSSTYTIQVVNQHGCRALDSVLVTVAQPFVLKVVADTMLCLGDSLRLPVSGAFTYQWITTAPISNTASDDPVLSPVTTTPYEVVGYDSAHCFTDTAMVNVSVLPSPTVMVSPVSPVTEGSITLRATGSADVTGWSWSPAIYLNCTTCEDPVCTPQRDITYTVTGTTADGCTTSDTVVVPVVCMASNVRIPGAFTPNNDGINDFFYAMGQGVSLVREFRVYGRWGNLVFERHDVPFGDAASGWDGRCGGQEQPPGAYIYDMVLQCVTGETFELKGTVMLER